MGASENWEVQTATIDALVAPEDLLQMWPVSWKVNRVGSHEDPKLIEAIR